MTTAFTPADQSVRDQIRTAVDRNLCVEAGAGTGKTTSLVSRIVELLASGRAEVDSVAVITFTEKAAAELSARVREALEREARDEVDPDRRRRLEAATRSLYRAHIETLHTFAANLLRERPVEAALDPRFRVLSDLEADLLFDDAYAHWLDDLLAGEHEEVERALNMGLGLKEIQQAAETVNRLRFLLPLEPFPMPGADAERLVGWVERHIGELRAIADRCLEEEDKALPHLDRLSRFAERLEIEGTTPLARERLVVQAAPKMSRNAGRQTSWDDPQDCRGMKELFVEYEDLRTELVEELRAAALVGMLPHVERFVADYERRRRDEGVADYDDLLIWARNLLRDRPEVRAYFARRFRALLIDEFQDTDPIQVEIATLLTGDGQAGDWRELEPADGRLFVVGDPKQSIYRFRRADIAIYDEVKRRLLGDSLLNLTQNFRSLPGVIGWVNRAFDQLFEEREGVQPPNVPLNPAPKELPLDRPPVVVIRHDDQSLDAEGVRRAEAEPTAELLRRAVLEEEWPVRDPSDGDRVRSAQWRDIAILLPARTGLAAYEDALGQGGIPFRHEGGRDYFRRQEVRDLILILRAIDDPTDRVSILGALRSGAFGCSDDDVVIHRASGGAWDYRPKLESQSEAVTEAFELLRDLWRQRGRSSLAELVQSTLERTRLVEYALTLPDGQQAAANLLAITDQARAFSAAKGGGLRPFARWLKQSTEIDNPEVDAGIAEEADDVLRLLTIHGAKGLEFPIVVLGGLASRSRETREPLPDERERRLHLRVGTGTGGGAGHYATPGYEERWSQEKAALEAERVRLLYVAATRARDHLVVSCVKASRTPGHFLKLIEPLLPDIEGHEEEADGAWVLDASELRLPPRKEEAAAEANEGDVERALENRSDWRVDHAAALRDARRELPFVVASSVERATRPLASEASHSGAALLLAEGPPLPVGDALHLVMERVTLPGTENLDELVESVCTEAGVTERMGEVDEMARRCLGSEAVQRALASGEYWREVPFAIKRDVGFDVGRIDMVYSEGDALVGVDYKTAEVEAENATRHVLDNFSGQAELYAEGIGRAVARAIRGIVFVLPRPGVEVEVATTSGRGSGRRRASCSQGP